MGGNKPFYPFENSTLIETVLARVASQTGAVAINTGLAGTVVAERLRQLPFLAICDEETLGDLGPLSGVLCALEWARARGDEAVITVPCDMPNVPADMVSQLEANAYGSVDVVYFSGRRDYPLCALWKTSVAQPLRTALEAAKPHGGLPVVRFLESKRVCKIKVENEAAFANINSPECLN
jgi:molybdopterin-guanine dinucleotide biosynthesis protein A